MRAAYVAQYGGPIEIGEVPEPTVGEDDVLVDVHASSVNPIDWKTAAGKLRPLLRYRLPLVLGSDVAGVVAAVGPRVERFRVGERVFGRVRKDRIGTFAERISVDARDLARQPDGLTHTEAASLPLVGLTAMQSLFDSAQLRAGHEVLIQAGSGGVGSIAIQLARHAGAEVTTTTSAKNADLVRDLGAHHVIDYRAEDFDRAGRTFDVILDPFAGEPLRRAFRVIRPGGTVVTINGFPGPDTLERFDASWLVRVVSWLGNLRVRRLARRRGARFEFVMMRASGAQLESLASLVESGAVRPVVGSIYSLDQAAEALAASRTGHARGKIAIAIRS